MTDTQLLTVGITLAGIFIAMLVNNHRMTDLRTDVGNRFNDTNRHIDDMVAVLRAEMKADRLESTSNLDSMRLESNSKIDGMRLETNSKLDSMRLETNSKLDSILTMMAGMDQRITRLEDRAR